jgi:hypothetical protein
VCNGLHEHTALPVTHSQKIPSVIKPVDFVNARSNRDNHVICDAVTTGFVAITNTSSRRKRLGTMKYFTGALLLCVTSGCYTGAEPVTAFRGLGEDDPTTTPPSSETSPTPTQPNRPSDPLGAEVVFQPLAALEGTVGEVHNFSAEGIEVTNNGGLVRIETEDLVHRHWVMTQLHVTTPITYVVRGNAYNALGFSVSLTCTGPRRGLFTYDGAPTRTVVRIDRGSRANTRTLSFTQYWDTSGDVLAGSFEFYPP